MLISDIITKFFGLVGIILTLYYLTPCHFITSLTFSQLLFKLSGWIDNTDDDGFLIFVYLCLYGINFFSSLIYNEVIIIHLWSMEINTVKYISQRQKDESDSTKNYYEENLISKRTASSFSSFDMSGEIEVKKKKK